MKTGKFSIFIFTKGMIHKRLKQPKLFKRSFVIEYYNVNEDGSTFIIFSEISFSFLPVKNKRYQYFPNCNTLS